MVPIIYAHLANYLSKLLCINDAVVDAANKDAVVVSDMALQLLWFRMNKPK